jgi:hypothetical protein
MAYPYLSNIERFKEFWASLERAGVPDRVNTNYLKSLGYTSSNDRKFPQVLRFLGLTDNSSQPTDDYRTVFRGGAQGKARLASLIRQNYAALYSIHADAHRKDTEAIQNFFRANTDLGDRAVQGMSATYKAVCSLADFETSSDSTQVNNEDGNGQDGEVAAVENEHTGSGTVHANKAIGGSSAKFGA